MEVFANPLPLSFKWIKAGTLENGTYILHQMRNSNIEFYHKVQKALQITAFILAK